MTPEVETQVVETPQKEEQPLGLEPETPTEEQEPAIEFDGKKYTSSQFKEMEKAYTNSTEWQKTNTQRAQEVAEERRQLEERAARVSMLEGLAEKVQTNPDLLKQIFAPRQEKDYDAELNRHWQQRPSDTGSQEYVNWEYQKDMILAERAEEKATKRASESLISNTAKDHNSTVSIEGFSKYKDKVSQGEFKQMAAWIQQNVAAPQGRYPKDSYDIAYRTMYFDKAVSDAALEGAKKSGDALLKAKPADGQNGRKPIDIQKTQTDLDDDEFIAEANARGRG